MLRWSGPIALAILLLLLPPSRAGLIVSIGDLVLQPGGTGFVDVMIRSDIASGDQLGAFGFEFHIEGAGPRRLEFVSPQPDPQLGDATYVFSGDSLDASLSLPVGSVSTIVVPNDTFVGGDSTASGGDMRVTSGRLLVRLQVTAAASLPPALGDTFSIGLAPTASTFFVDSSLNPVAFLSQPGTVSIVPEPASLILLGAGGILALTTRRRWNSPSRPLMGYGNDSRQNGPFVS
ncbi:MAG: PEP-CTERM sorting domain-containing protein [Isosphaeraceae bacterium]